MNDTVSTSDCLAPNTKMTGKKRFGKDMKGTSYGFMKVLIWRLPGWTDENHKNLNQDNWCSGQELR